MKQETLLRLRKQPWLKRRPTVQNRIHVAIADDHPIVLAGLESLFALEKDIKVVARCATGEETLAAVRKHRPDILLLDIRMPGKNTFDVIRELRNENLPTRVVLLTAAINDDEALEAVRLGVGGVVLKGMPPKLLIQCIRKVYAGERWMERGFLSQAVERLVKREAGARELANTSSGTKTLICIKPAANGAAPAGICPRTTRRGEPGRRCIVSIPAPDTYTALERGTVDGTIFAWEAISSFKIAEVLKHHVASGLYVAPLFTLMNLRKYESLPPDLRKVIDDLSGSWAAEFNGKVWDQNENVGIEAVKKAGGVIYTLPPEERQRWLAKLKPLEDDWIKSLEAKGLPARQLLSDLREAIKKYDP